MTDASLRTITLNSESLEGAIKVLSSAMEGFCLTLRQRIAYRALMICVDLAIASFAVFVLTLVALIWGPGNTHFVLIGLSILVFVGSSVAGAVSLLLNIPLLLRTVRERARLKSLGVTGLSKSLWKASRRHRWLSRIRSALLIVLGVLVAVLAGIYLFLIAEVRDAGFAAAFFAVVAAMLFAARHLRNQREQMDLAANADELKKALQSLREQAGPAGTVAVPAELVEQAAKIESAYIARERRQAILLSADSQSSGYAITFGNEAMRQRAALDVADRLDLEDLLAQLSAGGAQVEAHAGSPPRALSEGSRVEVEYVVDRKARGIRITAVKRPAGKAVRSSTGASHG